MNKQNGVTEKELGQVFGELLNPNRMVPKRTYRKTVMGTGLAVGLVSMLLSSATGAFVSISNTGYGGDSTVVFRVRGTVNQIQNEYRAATRLDMGDAKTTGARYLDPKTPANRLGIDIEGDGRGHVVVGPVTIFRAPAHQTLPVDCGGLGPRCRQSGVMWRWIHSDSIPVVDVLPIKQCAGPEADHNCVPRSFQITADLPSARASGEESGFFTSFEIPMREVVQFPDGTNEVRPFAEFAADAYGSTFWTAVKVRSEAQWINPDPNTNPEGENWPASGSLRLYGSVVLGVYLGPLLPQGAPPEITPAGTNVWEVAFGSWSKPKGVGFAKRRIVVHLCKSKTAGQEKSADVDLQTKHDCEVVDEQKIGQKKGRVSFRLDIANGQFLVAEDWLYLRAESLKSEPPTQFVNGKERVSGRTFEQRQAFVEEIPLMPFVTRSDSVAIP